MNKDLALKRYLKKEIKTILLNEGMMKKLAQKAGNVLSGVALAGALAGGVGVMNAAETGTGRTTQSQGERDSLSGVREASRLDDTRLEKINELKSIATRLELTQDKKEFMNLILSARDILESREMGNFRNEIPENDDGTSSRMKFSTFQELKTSATNIANAIRDNEIMRTNQTVANDSNVRSFLRSLEEIKNTQRTR